MRKLNLSLTLLICVLWGASAHAEPRTHDGFYMQAQVGLGYYSASSDEGGFEASFSGMTIPTSVLLGGSVMPGLTIGGGFFVDYAPSPTYELNGTESEGLEFTQLVLGLGLFADYYLDPAGGVHIQGFIGWGGLETSSEAGAGGSDPTGLVTYIGGGYDVFLTDEWSVGGLARFVYAPLSLNDVSYSTIAPAVLLALTYH